MSGSPQGCLTPMCAADVSAVRCQAPWREPDTWRHLVFMTDEEKQIVWQRIRAQGFLRRKGIRDAGVSAAQGYPRRKGIHGARVSTA
ncbi:hypothetical protein predicted by Glimmer/Critica [Bordetella petrii]|uniref:Uncharacterized protein n=1 Tax=Bordetella petrii (strain ATCC BAA-461 / DSM 12804 / CCUG 43448 / CIP 107267 / Se-1111R) TaxID=340100 RepID=A9IGZ9_BORPD|nr:hypothetical protein predicted by Glimmer/Critica [Bordetella petrii]